ncbi:MAG: hypothetical protein IKS96_00455 [Fibrobacter sp.]|nr:hypothetical protein [Fibrobacter sp.]
MRELKAYTLFTTSSLSGQRVYLTNDADAAIAELKARIQLDDDEMARFLQLEEECGGGDLRNYIAELKQKLHDLSEHAMDVSGKTIDKVSELKEAIRIKDELLIENGKQIGELKAENERLKNWPHTDNTKVIELLEQKLHDSEMRADLAEAAETERKIDYDNLKKEHRQALRALYMLRFAFSKLEQDYIGRFEYNENNWDEMWEKRADYWKVKADKFKEDV